MSDQPDIDAWGGEGALPTLYSKTATGALNYWQCWVRGDVVHVLWGLEGTSSPQESRFQCSGKNEGRANATDAHVQAIKEARAKWRKQVKKKYHWDREHWTTSTNLKPMLAKTFAKEKHKVVYPATIQPKLDGLRCFAFCTSDGSVVLQSRGGDPYIVEHIQAQLASRIPQGVLLDGELYSHGTPLQTINSLVRRPQKESRQISYVVYDHVHLDNLKLNWLTREMHLTAFFAQNYLTHVFQCPGNRVFAEDEVYQQHQSYVTLGYEGSIIRSSHGEYRLGYRSSELLKLKDFQDDEFEIVGYKRGKGKFINVPIFECYVPAYKRTFEAVPQGTAEERLDMLNKAQELIGKQLTVRFFNYTPDGVPFHPVGISIREAGT